MNAYATKLSLEGARRALAELERRNFALSHAAGALSFDAVTAAPPGNRAARSETIGYLGEAQLELVNSAEGIRLLDFLAEHMDELTEPERRSVRLLRRSGDILRAVSLEEYLSFRKLANEASNAWSRANESDGFSLLEPWLAGSSSPRATSPARPRRTPASMTSGSTSTRKASPRRAARSSSPGSRSARRAS